MRKDFLLFLSFLVDAGYIVSFRVTKDKIFINVLIQKLYQKSIEKTIDKSKYDMLY